VLDAGLAAGLAGGLALGAVPALVAGLALALTLWAGLALAALATDGAGAAEAAGVADVAGVTTAGVAWVPTAGPKVPCANATDESSAAVLLAGIGEQVGGGTHAYGASVAASAPERVPCHSAR
jgi:hypothetical protein